MYAAEQVLAIADLALDERNVVFAGQVVDVAVDAELTETGRHFRTGFAYNVLVMAAAVVLQILDGDDLEAPFPGLPSASEVRIIVPSSRMISQHRPHCSSPARRHRSTVASVWLLRVSNTAAACNKRENVSRTAQLLRLGVDIRTFAAGKATFLGGNAGRGVHMVDGDRERGVVVVGVDLYHLLETETECNLLTIGVQIRPLA